MAIYPMVSALTLSSSYMLLEFCCPVCLSPLAIKKQAPGGQVNCPKCQKLILIPSTPPLPRLDEDTPPFSPGQTRDVADVAEAIKISVEPYRRDLENKSELLNDAVEMIKVRNERIKEIETLMLETQRDLWALEVEHDAARTKHKKTQSLLKETRERAGETQRDEEARVSEIETLRAKINDLETREDSLVQKKDRLKARLVNTTDLAERLQGEVKMFHEFFDPESETSTDMDRIQEAMRGLLDKGPKCVEDLDAAKDKLSRAATAMEHLATELERKDRQRQDLEELVKSSSQDMQTALDDRKQWRNHAHDLEKKLQDLEIRLQEGDTERDNALKKLEADLSSAREELRETTQTAKKREQDAERIQHRLEETRGELEQTEQSLAEALETQNKLTAQNLQAEQQRKELKRKLAAAEDRVAELEST